MIIGADDVMGSDLIAAWSRDGEYEGAHSLRMDLAMCYVTGHLKKSGEPLHEFMKMYRAPSFFIEGFHVDQSLRNFGIGSRLLRAVSKEAKSRGAHMVYAEIISKSGIGVMEGVFGKGNASFFESHGRNRRLDPEELYKDFDISYAVGDMRGLDVSGWESPKYRSRFFPKVRYGR